MNGLKMHHLHPFFKQNKNRGHPPPRHPSFKRKKISRITYIGALKAKTTNNFGGKSTGNRQKWAKKAPFPSVFQKFFSGRPRPPPLLRVDKKLPSLVCLQLR